jgi:metal transporter CNNM
MIICSVACAESIPIIIEMLFGTGWLPIVISTIAIAIFAELLPQYLIPRRAIISGYYCWPFIWGCMCLTCIISWPLSYLLDTICGPQTDRGIYTLEQLEILIKFHERESIVFMMIETCCQVKEKRGMESPSLEEGL